MSEYEARTALQGIFEQFERRRPERRGLLGDSNGTVQVANRPGWAYIRYNENLSELCLVRYLLPDQLPDGTPVRVGKKYATDPYEQVLGEDWTMYAWDPSAAAVSEHATPAIDIEDLSPGKVVPTDPVSLSVDVRAFLYRNGDTAVEFAGNTLDLTANVPGVAGQHRMVLIYMDLDTDALAAENGDTIAVGTDADAPAVPENGLPLGLVDLANGETTIEAGDIYQYKIIYLSVGEVIDLTQLSDYARGYIIRGGAADWEAYDAAGDGYALVGDGTDILSDLTPNWKGTHTWTVGDDQGIIIEMDAAQTVDCFQIKDSGGDVTSGFDERGIPFADGDTSATNYFAGADAGNVGAAGTNLTAVGYLALSSRVGAYGDGTAVGANALKNSNYYGNTAVGSNSALQLTSGGYNVSVGSSSMLTNQTGHFNVAVGQNSLEGAGAGLSNVSYNVAVGRYTLNAALTGANYDTAVGYYAGAALTTGANCVFLGAYAGRRQTVASNLLLIDNQQRADAATELTHALAYGVMAANPEDQSLTANVGAFTTGNDNTPAYGGYRMANAVAAVAQTIIPNGTGDVTVGLQAMYFVSESGGGTSGGMATVLNGGSADLYDDGTDVLTLAVAADGSTTLQRTAGATTFDVSLWLVFI